MGKEDGILLRSAGCTRVTCYYRQNGGVGFCGGCKGGAESTEENFTTETQNHPHATDLVLTDLVMPELAGAEVVRAIKSIRPELPVLLVSGFASSLTEEAARGVFPD
jgi:CheY-like chemotaxis protein